MNDQAKESAWVSFWNRGGVWRAVLVAVVYLALYLVAGWLIGQMVGDQMDVDNLFGTPQTVFFALTLPLIIGAILLAAFVRSLGWFRPLFARQPIRGRGWMWIAPVLIVAAIVLRLLGIPYSEYSASVVALTFATGLLVGFVEEILTRGIAVKMLRDSGKSEWVVMVVSSLIFALLHTTNVLSGMPVLTVVLTVLFAFGFGICMYLTLRATGTLLAAMLIHGLYDPTLFLATGGVDHAGDGAAQNAFLTLAAPANILFITVGVIGLIFVRGHVQRTPDRPVDVSAD